MTHNLYIGSNNKTKRLELDKIKRECSKVAIGFTIIPVNGYWKNKHEKSIIVQISGIPQAKIMRLIKILKRTLKQQSIGYNKTPGLQFI